MLNQDIINKLNGISVSVAVADQLYETPIDVAKSMAEYLDILPGDKILEPSAGTGRLVDACLNNGATWDQCFIVEQNMQLADMLAKKYKRSFPGDFLYRGCWELHGPFDKVIMNPPFTMGSDIKHINHALTMLKPGGILVGICADGPRQTAKIKPLCSHWEKLPTNTFKNAGTSVNTSLFVIDNA